MNGPWIRVSKSILRRIPCRPKPQWRSKQTYAEYEFKTAASELKIFRPYNDIDGRRVLDVGCGMGGKSVWYGLNGARKVIGIDIDDQRVEAAWDFAEQKCAGAKVSFESISPEDMAERGDRFDLVVLSDVLEHVSDPRSVLLACWRLVDRGGQLRIKFPPYHSAYGGHCAMVRVPWVHLLFPQEALLDIIKERYVVEMEKGTLGAISSSLPDLLAAATIREISSVNQLTIGQFERMMPLLEKPCLYRLIGVRRLPLVNRLPLLREILVTRVVAVWQKQ